MQEAIIERKDYKVHFRSYSENLHGVRIVIGGECHYIINDTLKGDAAIEALYKLRDASIEFSEYGFVMLQKDNRLFVDSKYKYSPLADNFVYNDSSKVVDINKYKYSLEYGIEKYKNRWDL